ncbi:MAG: hypothetical protein V1872_01510 [bacterium]
MSVNKKYAAELDFNWETDEERIRKNMKISPEEKLRGLLEMNMLTDMVLTEKQKIFRRRLREE